MRYLALSLLFIFTGCNKDPYPETGNLKLNQRGPREVVPEALSMAVDDIYEFEEGRKKAFRILVEVPAPGKPAVEVDDLPAGAVFHSDKFMVEWAPDFFAGNHPADPTIKSRIYPITIWLRSSEDDTEAIKKVVNLVVHDVPQNIDINGATNTTVYENSQLRYTFEINNSDYPTGPFSVNTMGMPANTEIVKLTENRFQLRVNPDHHHVKINQSSSCQTYSGNCVQYDGKVIVYNPANHKSEKEVEVKVLDKRLPAKLVVPENMEQGLDITFQVTAFDMNGEVAPKISMTSSKPEVGEFETELIKDEDNNSSVLNISWKDIPPSYNGSTQYFGFKTCVLGSRKFYNNCVEGETTLQIVVKDRNPPTFSRLEWGTGDIKYLNHNERQSYRVKIQDGDSYRSVSNVEVRPISMQKYVRWSNDYLSVKFDKPGIHQFSLVATSEYNMSSAESFVVEVFKPTRSRTLYFTDSTRDAEVKFYRDTLKNVELLNPVLQVLNNRNLSGRETIILGTGILQDLSMRGHIDKALGMIKNVVVASPLVENMPDSFLDHFKRYNKVAIIGRYSQLPDTPALNTMEFVYRRDFQDPINNIFLKLNSTIESSDPVLFSTGVDTNDCADVLEISDKRRLTRYKIGVVCRRENGGRLAVLGTEFADLKTSEQDKNIPSLWFKKMLSTDIFDRRAK